MNKVKLFNSTMELCKKQPWGDISDRYLELLWKSFDRELTEHEQVRMDAYGLYLNWRRAYEARQALKNIG